MEDGIDLDVLIDWVNEADDAMMAAIRDLEAFEDLAGPVSGVKE